MELALLGNQAASEELVKRHRDWIYNVALRMVKNPEDAEDVTQDVLIKILTKLSTFKGKSRFRTWVYRIVTNQVINMKTRGIEKHVVSFSDYWKGIERTRIKDLPDRKSTPVDLPIIMEETKIQCMMGMHLCLNREQRLIFVLGGIFGVTDTIGSEIVEISKVNFRQKLSRSRRLVYNFINEKCSLFNRSNLCHCQRKRKNHLNLGYVGSNNQTFSGSFIERFKTASKEKQLRFDDLLDTHYLDHLLDRSFQRSPDFLDSLRIVLHNNEFQDIFDLVV
jgi:RNA polymerase sigma factor (sigma-70 family)